MDETLTILCDVPGHQEEKIVYQKKGWKFKDLRLWQSALLKSDLTMSELADLISQKIVSWTLTDDEGEPIEFILGEEALDELGQDLSNWVVLSFKDAYTKAGLPDPNSSSPPTKPESKAAK